MLLPSLPAMGKIENEVNDMGVAAYTSTVTNTSATTGPSKAYGLILSAYSYNCSVRLCDGAGATAPIITVLHLGSTGVESVNWSPPIRASGGLYVSMSSANAGRATLAFSQKDR